jgi:hypothetical protein
MDAGYRPSGSFKSSRSVPLTDICVEHKLRRVHGRPYYQQHPAKLP